MKKDKDKCVLLKLRMFYFNFLNIIIMLKIIKSNTVEK